MHARALSLALPAIWSAIGCREVCMILEVAILNVRPGAGPTFESAFAAAAPLIASMPGYLGHELQRCAEAENRYLLLARWETLEAHTVGFRGSPQYQEWRRRLHHFYDPFPVVEHYTTVARWDPPS